MAQVHSFSVLFKLLINSCRLLEINFVRLCKWLRICINAQRVSINLTKKRKNNFNEESAGFLPSNFCILLKGCYERERESNQRGIKYIIHTFSGKLIPQIFLSSAASLDSGKNYKETKAFFKISDGALSSRDQMSTNQEECLVIKCIIESFKYHSLGHKFLLN